MQKPLPTYLTSINIKSTIDPVLDPHREDTSQSSPDSDTVPWSNRLVIYTDNKWRVRWNVIVVLLLVYVATVFPYRLSFIESRIPDGMEPSLFWVIIGAIVDILFWIDLILNFFFTYDKDGQEIDDLKSICKNYLAGFFIWNFIACLPPELFAPLMNLATGGHSETSGHQLTRTSRLQRTTRMVRLARISRLAKLLKYATSDSLEYIKSSRGMRITNFLGFLLWAVHLLACGWYLCAGSHSNVETTWVWRRVVDQEDKRLLDEPPGVQWCHSMYFMLTLFTSVGFGDMSAFTLGETIYASFAMIVGAFLNNIIVVEVIDTVQNVDAQHLHIRKTKATVRGFCAHCRLQQQVADAMNQWIDQMSLQHDLVGAFDRKAMRDIITRRSLPQTIMRQLPDHVFNGRLKANTFIMTCLTQTVEMPYRLVLVLAVSLSVRVYIHHEVIYQLHDTAFNVFLVDAGLFAFVGIPTPDGGKDESATAIRSQKERSSLNAFKGQQLPNQMTRVNSSAQRKEPKPIHVYPYQLLCPGSYFGDLELLLNSLRHCTARCEGQVGKREPTLLLLHKPDYFRLLDEFPHFANVWASKAQRSEHRRLQRLAELTRATNIGHLAASLIQRFFRDKKTKHNDNSCQDSFQDEPLISASLTPAMERSVRADSSVSLDSADTTFISPGRRKRLLGNLSAQLEKPASETTEEDGFHETAAIGELREEIKTLQQSVAYIHTAISSSNLSSFRSLHSTRALV